MQYLGTQNDVMAGRKEQGGIAETWCIYLIQGVLDISTAVESLAFV